MHAELSPFATASLSGVVLPPPSTRCYPLPVLGLGTVMQESLPSYICRLARAHAVPTSKFFTQEIGPALDWSMAMDKHPVSNFIGLGSRHVLAGLGTAYRVSCHLASLTGQPSVARLIHPHIAPVLNLTRGLRLQLAWCPQCLREGQEAGEPLYYPFVWAFRHTRCCLKHNLLLREACPSCRKPHHFMCRGNFDRRCNKCYRSMHDTSGLTPPTELDVTATRYVHDLAAWLASAPPDVQPYPVFMKNLAAASHAAGGGKPLAGLMGLAPSMVGFWLRGYQTMTLDALVRLCFVFGIPGSNWFSGAIATERFAHPAPAPAFPVWVRKRRPKMDKATVEAALRASLAQDTDAPPPLTEVVDAVHASYSRVLKAFPDLAKRIIQRHREYAGERRADRIRLRRYRVVKAIEAVRASGRPVTQAAVQAQLGPEWELSRRRFRDVYADVMAGRPGHPHG